MLLPILLAIYTTFEQQQVIVSVVTVFAFAIYKLVVYPLFISPLKHIPGPYLYRISSIPSLNAQRKFQWIRKIHRLHKKYGPIVVLAPNSVSCNGNPKYVNDIYVKNMPKSDYYANFRFHGEVNMFAEKDNKKHIYYKKIVLGLYLKTAVFNPKNDTRKILIDNVRELILQIDVSSGDDQGSTQPDCTDSHQENSREFRKDTEVHSLFGSLAMDVVAAFELGIGNGTRLLLHHEERKIIHQLRQMTSMVFWTTRMPRFWYWAAGPEIRDACTDIELWLLNLYKRAQETALKRLEMSTLSTLEAFKKSGISLKKCYSNVSDNLIAGHDTTATQLTYMCYELSRPVNRSMQSRLQAELREAFGTPYSQKLFLDDLELVDELPFLDALIQENLRVHAPTPGPEYRTTNKRYDVEVGGRQVSIPPNTEISCLPYLMHRVLAVFPNPDKWLPERWLQASDESEEQHKSRTRDMQRYMMPFGKGVRMCLGNNLALIEMKLALASLYWHFGLTISSNWCEITPAEASGNIQIGMPSSRRRGDEKMMSMEDSYVSHPFHDECWLKWKKY